MNNQPKSPAKRNKCECGCGGSPKSPKSRFLPGHDAKLAHKLKVAESKGKGKAAKPKKATKKAAKTTKKVLAPA